MAVLTIRARNRNPRPQLLFHQEIQTLGKLVQRSRTTEIAQQINGQNSAQQNSQAVQTKKCVIHDGMATWQERLFSKQKTPALRDGDVESGKALLHKALCDRTSPFPGRTYPIASVTGMPRAV